MRQMTDTAIRKPGSHQNRSKPELTSGLAPLIAALRDFAAAWGVARHPPPGGTRKGEAAVALFLCAAIVETAYVCDAMGATAAAALPEWVRWVAGYVTLLGNSSYIFLLSFLVAVIAVLAASRGTSQRFKAEMNGLAGRATFVFVVNLVAGILAQLLKHLAGRARPKLMHIVGPFHFDLFSIKASLASFPSGHTITVFATATALTYCMPRLRLPLFSVAALVALSRWAIGAHYPSDVLAGMFFGTGTAIYLRRAFATRGLVFRRVGAGTRMRPAGSIAAAFGALTRGVGR